jgi:rhodanese-related sulfurtransferase
MAAEFEPMLGQRKVQIDPAELLSLMNDDYVELIIYDVRPEPDWNRFHLVDSERVPIDLLPAQRNRLQELPENAVVVVVSNDEILSTAAWKRLMALAKPNAYILEGGLNNWLNIYRAVADESGAQGKADLNKADGSLRHVFKLALGERHAAARPDQHLVPNRQYTPKVKLLKRIEKAVGCG